jgi:hypothetical protein
MGGGSLSNDVVDLVREELRVDLRTALHRAIDHEHPTLSIAHVLPMEGEARRVYLQVRPVAREGHATPVARDSAFSGGLAILHKRSSARSNEAMWC